MARKLTDAQRKARLARGLKRARRNAALSLSEAAAKLTAAGVPVTRNTLMMYERTGKNGRVLNSAFLPDVAAVYRCDLRELFGLRIPRPSARRVGTKRTPGGKASGGS